MNPVDVIRGDGPVVLGLPHTGTFLPPEIHAKLDARGRALDDTDWHIERLYAGLLPGATTVRAIFHRYVIDANRDPTGTSLYPGQNTTGLVPYTDFDGHDIWNVAPDAADIEQRLATYHAPYHAALVAEMQRVRLAHGVAILWDCHSIRSRIPFLFEGQLPILNIGTDNGETCAPAVENAVAVICEETKAYDFVLNGRFKGGWTTRHYGQPARNWHAIQMEIAQRAYLKSEAPPWAYDDAEAERLRRHLGKMLAAISALAPQLERST